jgi:hypothetical protein
MLLADTEEVLFPAHLHSRAVQPPPFRPIADPFNGALKRLTQKANS